MKANVRPNADDRVFVSFGTWINTAELIREDLTVADLELTDREGDEFASELRGFCLCHQLGQSVQKTGDFGRQP